MLIVSERERAFSLQAVVHSSQPLHFSISISTFPFTFLSLIGAVVSDSIEVKMTVKYRENDQIIFCYLSYRCMILISGSAAIFCR